ncbi:hypothetical protein [Novosphingobium sp. 9]|uniref:hypothetical protein n=1 Tax=Novosphingobium sp. 9 TaxID=2025349 RepID=UPI0021B695F2|nr:hypothetical protein [Novosphingobium sp. 9]
MKRRANSVAAIGFLSWVGLFWMGQGLTFGVYDQGPGIYPSAGQTDFYVIWPAVVALTLGTAAWVVNGTQRGFHALAALGILAIIAIFPFLFVYTGGV